MIGRTEKQGPRESREEETRKEGKKRVRAWERKSPPFERQGRGTGKKFHSLQLRVHSFVEEEERRRTQERKKRVAALERKSPPLQTKGGAPSRSFGKWRWSENPRAARLGRTGPKRRGREYEECL